MRTTYIWVEKSWTSVAEALAIWFGCEFAKSLGLNRIIVESDSKENISALAQDMIKDIFQSCRWSWVPRSANLAVDRLASRSNTEMCGSTWISRPPSSLVHILNKNGLPCPP
ncbi:hypothetical protein ACFX13_026101 [Malus domestica]